jgi:hypothetical protein
MFSRYVGQMPWGSSLVSYAHSPVISVFGLPLYRSHEPRAFGVDYGLSAEESSTRLISYRNERAYRDNTCDDTNAEQANIWKILRRKQAREVALRMLFGPVCIVIGMILIYYACARLGRRSRSFKRFCGVLVLVLAWGAFFLPVYWQDACESYEGYDPYHAHEANVSHQQVRHFPDAICQVRFIAGVTRKV